MVTSNWKTEWSAQRHNIIFSNKLRWVSLNQCDHICHSITFSRRHDEDGEFIEYREVERAAIDATCLRACRAFFDVGMKMLYSNNTFGFAMCNGSYHQSPPTLLHNEVLRPDPSKPNPVSDPRVLQLVQVGISEIQNQMDLTSLSGWVYYDPFLRFLHTIGPKKFPLIKSLEFSGLVKLHTCRWEVCKGKCDDDLVLSLELYIPVISSLLPNLEKLIIHACEDPLPADIQHSNPPNAGDDDDDEENNTEDPPSYESRLQALLKNQIRRLPTIKSLEVFDEACNKVFFAELTMQWFKERTVRRAHKKLVADLAEHQAALVRQSNVHCGFCGEGHIWAECYNLCNFCGGFGHFRKTCSSFVSQQTSG
jgi:hypothetical protein